MFSPLWPFPAPAFIPTTPGSSSFSCRPSNFSTGRPSDFFHLNFPGRRSVRIFPGLQFNFFRRGLQTCSYTSQCVSTSGLWRMGLFLILPLLLWQNIFLLSRKMVLWIRSETHDILSSDIRLLIFVIINLVPTAKPKTSQSHNIDLHQSTESTGTQIYFSSRFSMLSMLEPF